MGNTSQMKQTICSYRSKTVLGLVQWHESISITSDILVTKMLRMLDEMDPIPRNTNVNPFIPLDGHRSRLGWHSSGMLIHLSVTHLFTGTFAILST